MTIPIVTRQQWGARYPAGFGPAPIPAQEIWLHHSATLAPDLDFFDLDGDAVDDDEATAMRQLELIGQQRFGGGISYTFPVMPSGRVYEGHGIDRRGAHTKGRNTIARSIVLVGNYDTRPVTVGQIESAARLLVAGQRAGWWLRARLDGGHQQAPGAATACPGRYGMAAIPVINARAAAIAAGALTLEDDMQPDERAALFAIKDQLTRAYLPGIITGPAGEPLDMNGAVGWGAAYARQAATAVAAQRTIIDDLVAALAGQQSDPELRALIEALPARLEATLADGLQVSGTLQVDAPH